MIPRIGMYKNSVMALLDSQVMTFQSLFFLGPIIRSLFDQAVPRKTADLSRTCQPPAKRGELGTGPRAK